MQNFTQKYILAKKEAMKEKNDPWYTKGLKFKCTQCGQCCTGAPGYVWLTETDINRLSEHFNLSKKNFLQKYTYKAYGRVCLKDKNKKGDCIFLNQKKCDVYSVRPVQCQTFPWWTRVLQTEESWKSQAVYCEGIDHEDAEKVSVEKIQEKLKEYQDAEKQFD